VARVPQVPNVSSLSVVPRGKFTWRAATAKTAKAAVAHIMRPQFAQFLDLAFFSQIPRPAKRRGLIRALHQELEGKAAARGKMSSAQAR
jgi:hypothetical protein